MSVLRIVSTLAVALCCSSALAQTPASASAPEPAVAPEPALTPATAPEPTPAPTDAAPPTDSSPPPPPVFPNIEHPPVAPRTSSSAPGSYAEDAPASTIPAVEEAPRDPTEGPQYSLYGFIGGGGGWIKQNVRRRESTGEPAGVSLGAGVLLLRWITVEVGAAVMFAGDHASFRQTVCSLGDCETMESRIAGGIGWAEAGLQYRLLFPVGKYALGFAPGAVLGIAGAQFRRELPVADDCIDCASEELDLGAGPYVSPTLILYPWSRATSSGFRINAVGLRVRYVRYLSGDFTDAFFVDALFELW